MIKWHFIRGHDTEANSTQLQGTQILSQKQLASYVPDCARGGRSYEPSYKERKAILYPVNVARNIARQSAATHFVFPSDIELYPSPGNESD